LPSFVGCGRCHELSTIDRHRVNPLARRPNLKIANLQRKLKRERNRVNIERPYRCRLVLRSELTQRIRMALRISRLAALQASASRERLESYSAKSQRTFVPGQSRFKRAAPYTIRYDVPASRLNLLEDALGIPECVSYGALSRWTRLVACFVKFAGRQDCCGKECQMLPLAGTNSTALLCAGARSLTS
jgi:hypothetical protein